MKVHVKQVLTQINGQAFMKDEKPATLADIASEALLANHAEDGKLGWKDKFERFNLAKKVQKAEDFCDLTAAEITMIQEFIAKSYAPAIVGAASAVLEPEDVEK